jgi:23S rRNA (cytosine1962-C5)-methyltransferase
MPTPAACVVNPRGAKRLRSGLPWVYRQDILQPAAAEGGAIVQVLDERQKLIGHAFWAEKSAVAVRLLTRGFEPCNTDTLRRRLQQALARRQRLFPKDDAFRVVHGEADLLPGLFVDKYNDGLSVQLLSEGAERHKDVLLDELNKLLSPRVLALRNDTSAREFEFLPRENTLVHGPETRCTYHEGENAFEVDLMQDRKTGGFLDQRENHVRAGQYARGEGLDAFSYHGGFALALARGCTSVLALDQDELAAESARKNVVRNGLTNVTVETRNAFDELHGFDRAGRQFDTIVIDPPAFAKRKEGIPAAERAYRELNLRALKLLRPGGVLITCSCSGKISPAMFEEILLSAAADVHRPVQILERRSAGRDHPGLLGVAETEYLKCFILQAVET